MQHSGLNVRCENEMHVRDYYLRKLCAIIESLYKVEYLFDSWRLTQHSDALWVKGLWLF